MSDWTIESLVTALRARRISAVEITDDCLARIDRVDPVLRAFITVDADGARRAAKERDSELAEGRARGPLHGVPMAFKDLCATPGLPTSCGTRTRDYFVSERPCTAATRLVAAGAITLGKTNMTELALGPVGDNAHHGHVQNPWRSGHCSGGSSSGSGSAIAAGLVLGALGSDTGGSIRLPAACCGIVGLKPTYGRVSRAGADAAVLVQRPSPPDGAHGARRPTHAGHPRPLGCGRCYDQPTPRARLPARHRGWRPWAHGRRACELLLRRRRFGGRHGCSRGRPS